MSATKSLKLFRATWGCLQGAGGKMPLDEFLTAVKMHKYFGIGSYFIYIFKNNMICYICYIYIYILKKRNSSRCCIRLW